MATGDRRDPYGAFCFHLEIDSVIVAGFSEVSGLGVATEVEERNEGGVNDRVHVFPRGTRTPRLVLRRGLTDSDVLWVWHQEVVAGRVRRRSGRVLLMDAAGEERWRWNFEDAYPVRWAGPDLRADAGAVAVETLELVHGGFSKG